MVRYVSTRNAKTAVSSHEAVIAGLAPDGGLYTPLLNEDIHVNPAGLLNCSYKEQAARIISVLFDDYSEEQIRQCAEKAYDAKFAADDIVPLRKFDGGWLMELWHGPTSAFKDIALTILPHLLTAAYQMDHRNDTVAILTATSGDTGKAALSGFADVANTAITVFYPEVGVSKIQKRQMQTSTGNNVEVIAVKGNFDDCQKMVKEAVSSPLVKKACRNVTISSANSINIGRLVPQIVYYYHAYSELVNSSVIACGEEINFSVPTGNFGDILAGYLARCLGLPVGRLICASNKNHVLTDFIRTGTYDIKRPFHTTMSPSMDILVSSNLERLLFMLSGNDDTLISNLMTRLKENGVYTVSEDMQKKIASLFSAYWTDEEECAETIRSLYDKDRILIDPHTAVGLSAMYRYQEESGDHRPCVVLSTASPYKFSGDVYRSLGNEKEDDDCQAMQKLHDLTNVEIPENLAGLYDLPVRFTRSINIEDGMKAIAAKMEELSHD
ncbi:MAG: threonine synthase [Erysipelotrichaceae bacterium]|nr:threonine synthase [Erysipelotrichaceae bacterium]